MRNCEVAIPPPSPAHMAPRHGRQDDCLQDVRGHLGFRLNARKVRKMGLFSHSRDIEAAFEAERRARAADQRAKELAAAQKAAQRAADLAAAKAALKAKR